MDEIELLKDQLAKAREHVDVFRVMHFTSQLRELGVDVNTEVLK